MRKQLEGLRQKLETSLTIFPILGIIAAIALAHLALAIDRKIPQAQDAWYLFAGQPDSAREFLSTIASSLLTLSGVIFSITILVLQLASSQYSSRVLRTFLEDAYTRLAMSLFVGSFVFALLVLSHVHSEGGGLAAFVPALSTFIAFVLVLLCVGVFVRYIHHMAHSIRAIHIIHRVADEARGSLERLYPQAGVDGPVPASWPQARPSQEVVHDHPPGVLTAVREHALFDLACKHQVIISLVPQLGEFVACGAPLFRIWGESSLPSSLMRDMVLIGQERTPHQDPAFGLRQLVDVAERALSPGLNDPTTAVQALDLLHDLLRMISQRDIPTAARFDGSGRLRLILPRPGWSDYVHLAFDEIRTYGYASVQVTRRIRAALEDLLIAAPPTHRLELERQLKLLNKAVRRGFHSREEIQRARSPSQHGTRRAH